MNPKFELHNSSGATIATNDNWQTTQIGGIITSDQVADISASTLAPTDPAESAIVTTLSASATPINYYTAIVQSADATTGVASVEVYNLQ